MGIVKDDSYFIHQTKEVCDKFNELLEDLIREGYSFEIKLQMNMEDREHIMHDCSVMGIKSLTKTVVKKLIEE